LIGFDKKLGDIEVENDFIWQKILIFWIDKLAEWRFSRIKKEKTVKSDDFRARKWGFSVKVKGQQ
jgi:hypothetical protein